MTGDRLTLPAERPLHIPPTSGHHLDETDYAALTNSWITRDIAEAAMLRRADDLQGREAIVPKSRQNSALTYYLPDEPGPVNYRLRRDQPDLVQGKEETKYLGALSATNRLYFLPSLTLDHLADVKTPIAIVEAEKKALALWRLANYESEKPRFIPGAIPGVWNWRGTVAKVTGAKGQRREVKGVFSDVAEVDG